jgi:hypothetical protein
MKEERAARTKCANRIPHAKNRRSSSRALTALSLLAAGLTTVALSSRSDASTIIAHWTFEESQPNAPGPHTAELGIRANSSMAVHGYTAETPLFTGVTGGSNGSPWSFRSNRWLAGHYFEFSTSTFGFESIAIEWDQSRSQNAPDSFRLSWSLDGMAFTPLTDYTVSTSWQTFGAIATPSELSNAPTIYFRMTALNDGTGGIPSRRISVDDIIISGISMGVPAPSAMGLLAVAGMIGIRRRRRA